MDILPSTKDINQTQNTVSNHVGTSKSDQTTNTLLKNTNTNAEKNVSLSEENLYSPAKISKMSARIRHTRAAFDVESVITCKLYSVYCRLCCRPVRPCRPSSPSRHQRRCCRRPPPTTARNQFPSRITIARQRPTAAASKYKFAWNYSCDIQPIIKILCSSYLPAKVYHNTPTVVSHIKISSLPLDTREEETYSSPQVTRKDTTDVYAERGGASRVFGGRDDARSESNQQPRWIPPSIIRRDALAQEDANDAVFRKVRGILNKLTPDKFQKLSDDILQIGLNTSVVLKGVIFLIFEKALDEPKYSSMYAQLCKRLSDEASNFLIDQDPNTFRELLLKRCKVEFDNRSKATAEFDNDNGTPLSPEDEERRQVAKRKMLGNIRFIGELGKLEIVAEQILHLCIQQLFPRKSNVKDAAEDLECLCQIMKTCGRILDTEKAKPLMNQYFDRIAQYAENPELPLRIKFMLLDTMQLRKDNWVPRKATTTEGPMLMDQVTDIVSGETNGQNQRNNQMQNVNQSKEMFRRSLKIRDDMISSTPVLPFNSTMPDKFNSINGFSNSGNYYNVNGHKNHQRLLNINSGNNYYPPARINYTINTQQNNNTNNNMNNNNMKDLGPNIKKLLRVQQGTKPEDMSLRPAANSMLCKQIQIKPPPLSMTHLGQSNQIKLTEVQQIQIKQNSHDKHKNLKKDKGVSKEEAIKKGLDILDKLGTDPSMDAVKAAKAFADIKVPDRFLADVMYVLLFERIRKRVDLDEELLFRFTQETKKQSIISESIAIDCLKRFILKGPEYESDDDKTLYKRFSKYAAEICQNVSSISELAEVSENGKRYPAFLMVLQELNEVIGKNELTTVFKESKVNLLNTLPETLRTKEQLAEILQERNLTFLFPLLRIQSDLWKQITSDPNPTQFYKWIKENLDPVHYVDPGFITALTTVMVKFITQETNSTEVNATKADLEKEKSLLEKFKPIMRTFFDDQNDLQMNAIYALQTYFFSLDFPKGLLLRWFNLMYELEIVEEEAFLKWREDVTDAYPGKGKALFQVNTWLTWLAEAESEDEEDDDD